MSKSESPPKMVWTSAARTAGSGRTIHQDKDCKHLKSANNTLEKDRTLFWNGYCDWCKDCSEEYR